MVKDIDDWMAGKTLSQYKVFAPGEFLLRAGAVFASAWPNTA